MQRTQYKSKRVTANEHQKEYRNGQSKSNRKEEKKASSDNSCTFYKYFSLYDFQFQLQCKVRINQAPKTQGSA